jgi:hypothetical protein
MFALTNAFLTNSVITFIISTGGEWDAVVVVAAVMVLVVVGGFCN